MSEDWDRWIADPRELTFWEFLEADAAMKKQYELARAQHDLQRRMTADALEVIVRRQAAVAGLGGYNRKLW